ncbi:class II glutamine amidotransferase [Streptomyces sp. NPDC059994]|uniref:class II glutamine amidotransferase n=1 Tax=Streptomyces sp. NPDC059994 TaxID=3347029 RepID=UPI0036A7B1EA
MCRLFGMSSAPARVRATFWLVAAPDSLEQQSRTNPDGTGIGVFATDGRPVTLRQPVAAWQDHEFALEARDLESATFVAHVRYASTGGLSIANTHPFEQDGRLFAHNGVIQGMDDLEAELATEGPGLCPAVSGSTDSERFFALITREIRRRDGDVGAGIIAAARWVATHLPLYALNLVLTTPDELWALRYPDTHELYVLDRPGGGQHLDHTGTDRSLRVHSQDLSDAACVVVASEPMDDDPRWRPMLSGEFIHVSPGHVLSSTVVLPDEPTYRLQLTDLHPEVAASQGAS